MKQLFFVMILVISHRVESNTTDRILIISIPKSGTHLMGKLISLLTGQKHTSPGLVDYNHRYLIKDISGLNRYGMFSHVHSRYSLKLARALLGNNVSVFYIYRDPRDQLISWINHSDTTQDLQAQDEINMHSEINAYIDSKIEASINPEKEYMFKAKGIRTLYNQRMPWAYQNNVCAIKFEDLIGSQGDGIDELQYKAIEKVASYLNIPLSSEEVESIAEQLFGGTATFNEGKIGAWKKFFTAEHKNLFKQHVGQLLIDLGYENSFDW